MAARDVWDNDRATFLNTDEFGAQETLTYVETGDTAAVTVVPVELTYSIFDPLQNTNFYLSAEGITAPEPGDQITYSGNTFTILNIKLEQGVYLVSGIRQEVRQ